jgi:peptidoglycan/LPS O-acetylase OafA/YrhL
VIPGIEAWTMVLLSIGITLPLAVVSWFLVERHALGYRQACASGTKAVWKRLAPRPRVG